MITEGKMPNIHNLRYFCYHIKSISKNSSICCAKLLNDIQGMIVVSTRNPDPMSAFVALSGKQFSIQQSTDKSNPYIKWFSPNTFKYYVLLHDVSEGHEFK